MDLNTIDLVFILGRIFLPINFLQFVRQNLQIHDIMFGDIGDQTTTDCYLTNKLIVDPNELFFETVCVEAELSHCGVGNCIQFCPGIPGVNHDQFPYSFRIGLRP